MNPLERQREALEFIRSLLAEPDGWTQNSMTVSRSGGKVAYCLVGAIIEATEQVGLLDYGAAIRDRIAHTIGKDVSGVEASSTIMVFNDSRIRKHEDVVMVVDRALKDVIAEIEAT